MRIGQIIVASLCWCASAGPAAAQGSFGPPPVEHDRRPPQINSQTVSFGTESRIIELLVPRGRESVPLAILVPGADFGRDSRRLSVEWLESFFYDSGVAYVRIGTRREREVGLDGLIADITDALAHLDGNASAYRIDMRRILLVGYGSGGHFAARLATDPALLARAGIPFEAVKGGILLNGDGFDIPVRIAASSGFAARQYERLFGTDPAVQRALSPVEHADPPNAPAFLFAAAERTAFVDQAESMAALLRGAGAEVELWTLPRTIAGSATTYVGAPQHPRTAELRAWVLRVLGAE